MPAQGSDFGRDESERRLAIATRAARIGIWDWNLEDNSFVYSALAKEIYGMPVDEPVTYETVRAVTHPDDFPWTSAMARRAVDPALREREPYIYRIVRADTGEERWVLAHGEATFEIVDGVEKATRYTGTVQDITDQKRAQDALAESEARLRLALDAGEMAVWEIDLEKQTITHSPQLNRLCGFPDDAAPSLDELRSRYAPGERERMERDGQLMLERGETHLQAEFKQIWPDGTEKWLLLRAAMAPKASGSGPRVIGVLMDVTERRLAEERLRTVTEELQHRLRNSLTVVQTIASQTFRHSDAGAFQSFLGRIQALAAASDLASLDDTSGAMVGEIVEAILGPFHEADDGRVAISGDEVTLPSKVAIGLGMALHELSTNAAKYGALSSPGGKVSVGWQREGERLELEWREDGGPAVTPPARRGFGSALLERGAFAEGDGRVTIEYRPEGVVARITLRLQR